MINKKETVHDFVFIGRILNLLKILQEETDECTSISQSEIIALMEEYGSSCSARTLTDYLKVLMKELNPEEYDGFVEDRYTIADYKIIPKGLEEKLRARDLGLRKEGAKKLQLRSLRYNHLFSFDELNQIVEAILFLKNIDVGKKKQLITKIQTLSSVNYPKYSPFISETTGQISTNILGVFEHSKIDENLVRENLTIIRNAIEYDRGRGHKISFHFNAYDENKELKTRVDANGKPVTYIANPYYVILYNGKYYLVCSVEPYSNVSFYRIDLMSDISHKTKDSSSDKKWKTVEKRKPKRDVTGLPEDWTEKSASKFQAEHMYMFYGEPINIVIKIDRERYTLLHDFFGDFYSFKKQIDNRWDEVTVQCVPKAMESWAMQCSDYVEIISPSELRDSIRDKCESLMLRYK